MTGVYLDSGEPSPSACTAGFVLAQGWAHEPAWERGRTELLMAWLRSALSDLRLQLGLFLEPLTTALMMRGSPAQVEAACARVAALLQERQAHERQPQETGSLVTAVTAPDGQALWLRWGAQGVGLLGFPRYGLTRTDSLPRALEACRASTLVPIGVDTRAAEVLQTAGADSGALSPPTAPVLALPGHVLANDETTLAWIAGPDQEIADAVVAFALSDCFAPLTPQERGLVAERRSLGHAGSHTTIQLERRQAQATELSALAEQVRRLRQDGPTEVEVLRAMESVGRDLDPTARALRAATSLAHGTALLPGTTDMGKWLEETSEVSTQPAAHTVAVGAVLDSLLVLSPDNDDLSGQVPRTEHPRRTKPLGGRRFRTNGIVAQTSMMHEAEMSIGAEGISVRARRTALTIPADEIAAVECWPDGERTVVSTLGYRIHVDPIEFGKGEQACAAIDALAGDRLATATTRHPQVTTQTHGRWLPYGRLAPWLVAALVTSLLLVVAIAWSQDRGLDEKVITTLVMGALGVGLTLWTRHVGALVRRREARAAAPPPGPQQQPPS